MDGALDDGGLEPVRALATALDEIPESVDIVDVFRKLAQIVPHALEAIRLQPRAFWMQLGIENDEAATLLVDAGIDVVMNLCTEVEHRRLCK